MPYFDDPGGINFYDREIIRLFVHRDRREGFLFKLDHGQREGFVNALHGRIDFDSRWIVELEKKPTPAEIHKLMRQKGGSEKVYVVSMDEDEDDDGKLMSLLDALQGCIGLTIGTIIYCIEGQVAYYESDDRGSCLLHRDR